LVVGLDFTPGSAQVIEHHDGLHGPLGCAAWTWCGGHPRNRVFISGDRRLLEIVEQLGFKIVEA
jgi:hypothetical protein